MNTPRPRPTDHDQSQARMWRRLAQQCREYGDKRMAEEAETMANRYEARRRAPSPQDERAA